MLSGHFTHDSDGCDRILASLFQKTPRLPYHIGLVTAVILSMGLSWGQESRVVNDFGSVDVGMTSRPVNVSYSVNRLATFPVVSISGSGDFVISAPLTSGTGDDCSVWVTFVPTAPGLRQGSLVVRDSSSNEVLALAPLTGTGVAPQLSVLPGSLSTVGLGQLNGNLIRNGLAGKPAVEEPTAIALGPEGDLIIADSDGNRVFRYVVKTGAITIIAGTGKQGYSGDGHAAVNAQLDAPGGVAVDGFGNIYVADTRNNVVRIIDGNTQVISTFAGGGANYGSDGLGDGGQAKEASLSSPTALIADRQGRIYIADTDNNVIRKVDVNGIISVVAGSTSINTPTSGNDGIGDGVKSTSSLLNKPAGLALDLSEAHLYIADTNDNLVRAIDMITGQIDTIAGTVGMQGGWQGDGGPAGTARLNGPSGLAVDVAGDLYIADTNNHVVRRVDVRSKLITTVAGTGIDGFSSAGLANAVALSRPIGLVMDPGGDLFIADFGNLVVQKVDLSGQVHDWPTAVIEQKSGSIPGTITAVNSGNEDLSLSRIISTADLFQQSSGRGNYCSSSTILHAGDNCQVAVGSVLKIDGDGFGSLNVRTNSNSKESVQQLLQYGVGIAASSNAIAGTSSTDAPPTPIVITAGTSGAMTEGTTQQFQANIPVSWSLAPGSVGSIDPWTGLYTAPAAITAKVAANGCQVRPNDDIFSTPIDNLPLAANNAAWIAGLKGVPMGYESAWGVSTFDQNTPTRNLTFTYTGQYNGSFPIPVWPALRKEAGDFSIGYANGTDHHYSAVNMANCSFVDVYGYTPGATSAAGTATSGIKYSGLSWALPGGGTDAAGMELSPVTLHLAELESGHIDHALRFSMSNNYIQPSFVWPATANAFPNSTNMLPYGSRLRLRRTALDPTKYSPMAQTLLNQLLHQGIILADGGPYTSITIDQDIKEDPLAWSAINEASKAVNAVGGLAAFEVVDESSLKISASSGAVNPANAYVAPATYAQVIATDLIHPTNKATSGRILFQGVGIGVPNPGVTISSGAAVRFKAWTTGTTFNNSVAWRTNPTVGSMTATGLYTAPKVVTPTRVILTAYSQENPSAAQPIAATILPLAADGSIRVSDIMGSAYSISYPGSTVTDSNKITWWSDPGFFLSGTYNYCDWGGAGNFLNGGWCSFGPDATHDFMLNNGNYKITLFIGVPSGDVGRIASWNIGTQGQWDLLSYNVVAASNNAKQLATVSIPAQVVDNRLSFTVSDNIVNNSVNAFMSGFAIAPDASGPHLTLSDSGGNTVTSTVLANTTMQFNAVGWYMSNSVSWSISPQVGSISSTGLYTAPVTPRTGTVTLTATSQSDPTKKATMTINLVEGKLAVTGGTTSLPRSLSTQFASALNGGVYSNVRWSASLGTISPTGFYTAPDPLAANTTATITAISTDDPSLIATFTISLLANMNPVRINAGDWYGRVTDASGNIWSSDSGYDVGTPYHANPFVITGTELDGRALSASSPMAPIYNSSRYSSYTPKNQFTYSFKVPNGTYGVTLLFANYSGTSHICSFNVSANGMVFLQNYDPDATAFHAASSQSFNVTVKSQMLTLNFAGIGSKIAEVNGIEIVALPQ